MKLYVSPGSCSLVSHICLEEAGADFEVEMVRFAEGQQRSAPYLAVNPKGRVPALVTDRGVLTENIAILAYLAEAYPKAALAPADPWLRARMTAFNGYMASTVHVYFALGGRPERYVDGEAAQAALKAKSPANAASQFAIIETEYLAGPWVMGEAFSTADIYLFVMTTWFLARIGPLDAYPKIRAHHAVMLARPAVLRAMAREAGLRAAA